jgi:diaminohydroxyphosphoribosylaminopyrimidine deaminase/5-amino-6-(5-phosphoribosylamino)uracil reductase
MRRALFHAARGLGRTTPNPMVGAVVVSPDGVIVGQGWHERAGEPHAEVHALDAAGTRARGGTLFVSLEPCCHVGRTGPCTRRIIDAGIGRVVAAMRDPDERVSGRGFAQLRAHGIDVAEDVCEAEAARLNAPFLSVKGRRRPLVVVKAATSLDARVAARPGERTALSSPTSNRRTQRLRASVDAIGIGSQTLLVDDPLLTVREVHRVRPLVRVIFDRRLRTPASARVFSTLADGPVIILTGPLDGSGASERARRLAGAGATVVPTTTLDEGIRALLQWNVSSLLVEGGPHLHAALAEASLVDRLHLIVAPHVVGDAGVPWLGADQCARSAWSHVVAEPCGPDVWIEADVHGNR